MLQYKDSILTTEYNSLREAVGWGSLPKEQAQAGLEHSYRIISCYDDHK